MPSGLGYVTLFMRCGGWAKRLPAAPRTVYDAGEGAAPGCPGDRFVTRSLLESPDGTASHREPCFPSSRERVAYLMSKLNGSDLRRRAWPRRPSRTLVVIGTVSYPI